MLITYDVNTNKVISTAGYRGVFIKKEKIDLLELNEPLPEGQNWIKIYDRELIDKIWELVDSNKEIKLIFDNEGNMIDFEATEKPAEIVESEEIDEEKIAMAEAIVDLDARLKLLEGGNE